MPHAYVIAEGGELGIQKAAAHAEKALGIAGDTHPDLVILRFGLFSVDDARKLSDIASAAPVAGSQKAVIVSLTRFFHEAQNALLKLFEEPPPGVSLYIVLPTEGMLLPTLKSRMTSLTQSGEPGGEAGTIDAFLTATAEERKKLIDKLLERAKADKDEDKQRARNEAVMLLEGLVRVGDAQLKSLPEGENRAATVRLLDDLAHFLPLMHTRSAPLKLIFEHLLLVIPKSLAKTAV